MREARPAKEFAQSAAPMILAAVLLLAAPWWQRWLPAPISSQSWTLPILVLLALLASLYAPLGRWSLSLGCVALPAVICYFGAAIAGWLAATVFVTRQLLLRALLRDPRRVQEAFPVVATASDAGRLALATLAAGWVWQGMGSGQGPPGEPRGSTFWLAVAASTYALLLVTFRLVDWKLRQPVGELKWAETAATLGVDLAGWAIGAAAVFVVVALGWPLGLVLILAVAVLAAETARNIHLRHRAVERVTELWEVTRAGHRIIFRNPDLASMAEQVLVECRNVLPFSWFQFELLDGEEGHRSWRSGPEGRIEEGVPEPADSPPALPGIHRRSSWRILQRQLEADGEAIAVLRFWCDPRRLEPTAIELFDSLLPQVASSVHRALLDRRAKYDALTGLADRRVLESRLETTFAATRDEGGSMAVIMCDLDRFKKINDTYGHDIGDRALLQVAKVLEDHRRDTDICCRYGGEEFALVLEKTDGETAQRVAERLRLEVQRAGFTTAGGERVPLRLSAGVAAFPELFVKTGKEILVLADEALMEAKRRGRNRSLLNLGRGRYRAADGKALDPEEVSPEPEAPTLFA
jgi:diguanylate cyclase (GGDEF)-like protein